MEERTVSRVEGWDAQSFPGGYEFLRQLADAGFSGTVRTRSGTWAFLLNGRIIGVFEGTIEDFDRSDGTVYEAPHPSLPLLFAMLENEGEQRAKYYTNDTPISEAHQQLSGASFTGYIELSENVLSGDYYVVYYGGRSMSCAFVGNAERLETGDDAFELADDEVGIYEVRTVDVEVVEIPEPAPEPGDEPSAEDGADQQPDAGQPGTADEPGGPPDRQEQPASTGEPPAGDQPAGERAGTAQEGRAGGEPVADQREEAVGQERPADPGRQEQPDPERPAADPAAGVPSDAPPRDETRTPAAGRDEPTGQPGTADAAADERASTDASAGASAGGGTAGAGSGSAGNEPAGGARQGADGRAGTSSGRSGTTSATAGVTPVPRERFETTQVVPSLDPDRTGVDGAAVGESDVSSAESAADADTGSTGAATGDGQRTDATTPEPAPGDPAAAPSADAGTDRADGRPTETSRSPEEATGGAVRSSEGGKSSGEQAVDAAVAADAAAGELRAELAEREGRIEELEAQLADLRVQRDGLRDERDRLRQEVQQLEAEIADLREEIDGLRSRLNDGVEGKRRLDPEEALRGTDLFVRYGSKSGGTLEKAHAGDVGKEEVDNNLRLEYHTQFEAEEVAVDGEPYEQFLEASPYMGFVDWLVRDLLYEVRGTGHVKGLKDLYDALPQVDRAELLGQVSVAYTEDGEQYREQRTFDVVLRDRMGNPLVVADINDSRNPATREMMTGVIENATDVKESNDPLASALLVTASFFEPGALEAADEAAGGGLLGGSSRESFVRLSRKRGYHLLLVEARGGEFHVNVPEL